MRIRAALAMVVLGAATAGATPTPPPWEDMLHDAKGIFERQREDVALKKLVRAGEPRVTSRRTAVQLVPAVYQDVDCVYQTKKFGAIEKQRMTLHYEHGSFGWTMAGYSWGDVTIVREGNYPPRPAPPSAQEVLDAVRGGLREWKVRSTDIETVTPTGKAVFSWLDDVPTAGYLVPVRVQVRDIVDRTASYGARYKTRFVCDLKVQLALEDQVSWTMQGTVPDCADEVCSLQRQCKDTWANGAGPPVKARGTIAAAPPPPPPRRGAPHGRDEVVEEEPPPPKPRAAAPAPKPAAPPAAPKPAAPPPPKTGKLASGGCPAGQFATPMTNNHCCWPNQLWSDEQRACLGSPRCPKGLVARGTECANK